MLKCNVKYCREQQSLTQRKLAKMSGVAQAAISEIENSKKVPTLNTVYKLAEALGICPKSLIYCDKIDCQYSCSCCKQALK